MALVTIKYGVNVLEPSKAPISKQIEGTTLNEALVFFAQDYPELLTTKIFVYKNSKKVLFTDWINTELQEDDVIDIIPYVGDPITLVTAIGYGLSMTGVGWAVAGAAALLGTELAVGYYAYDYARDYLKELMKPPSIDMKGETPTYSWNGAQTTAAEGGCIPLIYGEHMVGGNVIGEDIQYEGDFNARLTIALALGEAPFNSLNITDMLINEMPRSGFTLNDFDYHTSLDGTCKSGVPTSMVAPIGSIDLAYKTDIDGSYIGDHSFFDIGTHYTNNNEKSGSVTQYFSAASDIKDFKSDSAEAHQDEWLGVYTSASNDILKLKLNFSYLGNYVPIAIRYALLTDPDEVVANDEWIYYGATWVWQNATAYTYTTNNREEGPSTETSYTYKITVRSTSSSSINPDQENWFTKDYSYTHRTGASICYDDVYCLTGGEATTASRKRLKTINLTGSRINLLNSYNPLSVGQYVRVQVKRLDINKDHYVTLDSIIEEYTSDSYYYDTAIVRLEFPTANETLNGTVPTFKFPVKGISNIRVYDSLTHYTPQWSDNPVWCLCDLLTNKRYGAGEWFTYDNIDIASARIAAAYCDTGYNGTKFTCNLVYDTDLSISEAIQVILETFGGFLVFGANEKIKILVDGISSTRQIFSRANIIDGSLSYSFGSKQNEYNALELRYSSANNNFKETALFMAMNEIPLKEQQITLRGVTNREQASYLGSYKLQKAYRCNENVTFKTNYDAIACEAGDVIGIQDFSISPEIYGGRIVSSTSNGNIRSAVIDQDVTVADGHVWNEYSIQYSYVDVTLGTVSYLSSVSSYTAATRTVVFTSTTFPTTANEEANSVSYALFLTSSEIDKFRIASIKQNIEERTFEINAVKYDAQIYDPSQLYIREIPEDVESITKAYPVRNVYIERTTDFTGVKIWFDPPTSHYRNYSTCKIDYQGQSDSLWKYVASMPFADGYVVSGLTKNTYYTFRFTSINTSGQANTEDAVYYSIYSTGVNFPPDVTGLQVIGRGNDPTFVGRDCSFDWDDALVDPGSPAIIGYVIEIWVLEICVRRTHVTDSKYTYLYADNALDNNGTAQRVFEIRVWAENSNHVFSEHAATLEVTNVSTLVPTNLVANFDGNDCVFVWEAPVSTIWWGFEVEVYSAHNLGGGLLKSDTTYTTSYRFMYEDNTTHSREISARVRTIDEFGQYSEWVERNATNSSPGAVTGLVATGVLGGVSVSWNPPTVSYEYDIIGYNIYADLDATVTAANFHSFTNGTSKTLTEVNGTHLSSGNIVYVRVVPVDGFGEADFSASPIAHATVVGIDLPTWAFDLPLTSGIDWSSSVGIAYWTSGSLTFDGSTVTIPAGNTTVAHSIGYIYWDEGTSVFAVSIPQPTLTANRWIMAYFDGTSVWQSTENKIIHGGLIQAGTVTAEFGLFENLASISTKTGALEVDALGSIRGGMTGPTSGSGFWMGADSGTYKFGVQGSSGNHILFDGENVSIKGELEISSSDWGLPIDNYTQMLFHFDNSVISTGNRSVSPTTNITTIRKDGWRGGCVGIDESTTNLLGSSAGFEAAIMSAWNLIGTAITTSFITTPSDIYSGTNALRLHLLAASAVPIGDGVYTTNVACGSGTHTVSVFLKSANLPANSVRISLYNNGASLATRTISPSTSYEQYSISGSATAGTISVRVTMATASLSGVLDIDCGQIEAKAFPTSYSHSVSVRNSGQLIYPHYDFPRAGSLAVRVRLNTIPTGNAYIIDHTLPQFSIHYTSAGSLVMTVAGTVVRTLTGLNWSVGSWNIVTASWDFNSTPQVWLLKSGITAQTASNTSCTWSSGAGNLYLGSNSSGSSPLNGCLDELRIDSIARNNAALDVWAITTAEFVDPNYLTNRQGSVVINDDGIIINNGSLVFRGEDGDVPFDYVQASQVFTGHSNPTVPYFIGDLWADNTLGTTRVCVTAKTAAESFALADWEITGSSAGGVQTFTTTPVPPYNIGDIWGDNGKTYICIVAKGEYGVFSLSDWRLTITQTFTTTPVPPYNVGDLWGAADLSYICINPKTSAESFAQSDWRRTGAFQTDITGNAGTATTSTNTLNVGLLASTTVVAATNLTNSWRNGTDPTRIAGAMLYADSVALGALAPTIRTNLGLITGWAYGTSINGALIYTNTIACSSIIGAGVGTSGTWAGTLQIATTGTLTMISGSHINIAATGSINLVGGSISMTSASSVYIYGSSGHSANICFVGSSNNHFITANSAYGGASTLALYPASTGASTFAIGAYIPYYTLSLFAQYISLNASSYITLGTTPGVMMSVRSPASPPLTNASGITLFCTQHDSGEYRLGYVRNDGVIRYVRHIDE